MAKFTKVMENGQVQFDFEEMEKEVTPEFVSMVKNTLVEGRKLVSELSTDDYKEVVICDDFCMYYIQATKNKGVWKSNKIIMTKYDIRNMYNHFYEGV